MNLSEKLPLAKPWFGDEELVAVSRVLDSGWVVQGPEVAAFEQAVADLHELPHGVAVSSATAGLHLIYLALGIGPGDVVLVPSFAWPSAANMAARVGATPWFVDVDPLTCNLTAATLERSIAAARRQGLPEPRAVVAVHEFGLAAPMDEVNEIADREGLIVIEDAACALGARYANRPVGNFSRAAVFSFHPRKSITTGEGGVVVTRDEAVADAVRALRNHGQEVRDGQRQFTTAGFNYRLTEIQAAIGRVQLERLAEILSIRRRLATTYLTALEGTPGLALPAGIPEHTWQTFMVVLESPEIRERVQAACRAAGIEAGPGSVAGHSAPIWESRFTAPEDLCPVSTRLAECGLALPLHPRMTEADIQRVATTLRNNLEQ
jgi:dTDP-4-amino-4,6-dideoxygalactose transaminase